MKKSEFASLMHRADFIFIGDFKKGYQRGLRKKYHGENFGTAEEHEKWLLLGLDGDHRVELGEGYRAGYNTKEKGGAK